MQKQTMGIFPQPLARYQVWAPSWHEKLSAVPVEYRGNHSYSSDTQVLDSFPELKSVIERSLNDFASSVMGLEETLHITQSWINVYNAGDHIHQHNHPNSIVSGTWYWSTPETEILFHKHGLNSSTTWTMKLDQKITEQTPFAVQTNAVRVEENDLLFWPSYLQHSVAEHSNDTARKTLSFNSMPRTWGSDLYRAF